MASWILSAFHVAVYIDLTSVTLLFQFSTLTVLNPSWINFCLQRIFNSCIVWGNIIFYLSMHKHNRVQFTVYAWCIVTYLWKICCRMQNNNIKIINVVSGLMVMTNEPLELGTWYLVQKWFINIPTHYIWNTLCKSKIQKC